MGFDRLLGNEQLKARLSATFDQGKEGHSYLICGPEGSGKHTLADLLSAALQCENNHPPCMTCNTCRKVMEHIHPDVIVVDDPTQVQVPVEVIRNLQSDAYIRPNEGKRKVFLIPRAGQMNESGQNALLKLMEEPPSYGAFLLLAPTAQALLPTIRSRCSTLWMAPLDDRQLEGLLLEKFPQSTLEKRQAAVVQSGGFLGQAMALMESETSLLPQVAQILESMGNPQSLELMTAFVALEKCNRAQAEGILQQLRLVVAQALAVTTGQRSLWPQAQTLANQLPPQKLQSLCKDLAQAMEDCRGNVNVANIFATLHSNL